MGGGSVSLTFDAVVQASGPYKNTAQVTAQNEPDLDSTPNNDDDDQSEDDESSATASPNPTPIVGIAKAANNLTDNEDGSYNITYTLKVVSYGSEMFDIQVTDALTTEFGTNVATAADVNTAGTYTITNAPMITATEGGATVTNVVAGFNGDSNQNLISPAAGESMPTNSSITLEFTMKFYPMANKTSFENQAIATGDSTENGVSNGDTTDLSDDGACAGTSSNPTATEGYILIPNPDIDCDGNPNETGENDPTFFHLEPTVNCPAEAGMIGF